MRQPYQSPDVRILALAVSDIIAHSAEVPPFDDTNTGEWDDL